MTFWDVTRKSRSFSEAGPTFSLGNSWWDQSSTSSGVTWTWKDSSFPESPPSVDGEYALPPVLLQSCTAIFCLSWVFEFVTQDTFLKKLKKYMTPGSGIGGCDGRKGVGLKQIWPHFLIITPSFSNYNAKEGGIEQSWVLLLALHSYVWIWVYNFIFSEPHFPHLESLPSSGVSEGLGIYSSDKCPRWFLIVRQVWMTCPFIIGH